jgi:hypothetical protein
LDHNINDGSLIDEILIFHFFFHTCENVCLRVCIFMLKKEMLMISKPSTFHDCPN